MLFVVSNKNTNLLDVTNKLRDAVQKRGDVIQNKAPYQVTCNVAEIKAYGTIIELRVPISMADFQVSGTINKQAEIMTFVREKLNEYGVHLVELQGFVPPSSSKPTNTLLGNTRFNV